MRLLLLAGAGEALRLGEALAERGIDAVASFAGGERRAEGFALPCRVGGFGGAEGFADYLRREKISAVLDATHPFAEAVSARSAEVCRALGLPYLLLMRPEWRPEAGDDWVMLGDESEAAAHIGQGETVFLATGRRTLARFANLEGREVIARQLRQHDAPFPFEGGRYLRGAGPFTVESEKALFQALGVDWLVVKNAGGEGARAKLIAARELGLKVGMIRRPKPPRGASLVQSVYEALAWVDGL